MRIYLFGLSFLLGGVSFASQPLLHREAQLLNSGKQLFQRHCMGCHGADAKGNGPSAVMLNPRPRNLVEGSFKFRSTPTGNLPTRQDLMRTLEHGVVGTSMPSFRELKGEQREALAAYIQSLREDWKLLEGRPVALPSPPEEIFTKRTEFILAASRGYKLYMEACHTCHGDYGRGAGPQAEGLTDGENQPIKPADLGRMYHKAGLGAKAIFRSITTGLDGSPMPGFLDVFDEKGRWDLVAYVMFLRGQRADIYPSTSDDPSKIVFVKSTDDSSLKSDVKDSQK